MRNFLYHSSFPLYKLAKNSFCEVLSKDYERLEEKYRNALSKLKELYGLRFVVRPYNDEDIQAIYHKQDLPRYMTEGVFARFFTEPILWCDYTYISDIDIFFTQPNIQAYYKELEGCLSEITESQPIHFNPIRKNDTSKMCGTFCVKTKEFYTQEFHIALEEFVNNDMIKEYDNAERLLKFFFKYMSRLPHSEITNNYSIYRKMFGIHTSLSRPPRAKNII